MNALLLSISETIIISEMIKINFVPFDTRKNLLQITQNKGVCVSVFIEGGYI